MCIRGVGWKRFVPCNEAVEHAVDGNCIVELADKVVGKAKSGFGQTGSSENRGSVLVEGESMSPRTAICHPRRAAWNSEVYWNVTWGLEAFCRKYEDFSSLSLSWNGSVLQWQWWVTSVVVSILTVLDALKVRVTCRIRSFLLLHAHLNCVVYAWHGKKFLQRTPWWKIALASPEIIHPLPELRSVRGSKVAHKEKIVSTEKAQHRKTFQKKLKKASPSMGRNGILLFDYSPNVYIELGAIST